MRRRGREGRGGGRYHGPIHPHERRIAVETEIHTRYKATHNEDNDAEVVELVAELCDGVGMAGDGVVGCGHAEACCGGEEEGAEGEEVRGGGRVVEGVEEERNVGN